MSSVGIGSRFVLVAAVASLEGLLIVGCADGTNPTGDPDVTVPSDLKSAHQLRETTIAECMRGEGFEYEPVVFVEDPDLDLGDDADLRRRVFGGPDNWRAYGATMNAVLGALYVQSEATSGSDVGSPEYLYALVGSQDPEGDHTEIGEDGCLKVGSDAIAAIQLDAPNYEDRVGLIQRLLASPQYLDFERSWAACMSANGVELLGSDRFSHTSGWSLNGGFLVGGMSPQEVKAIAEVVTSSYVLDESALDVVVALNADLEDLFARETEVFKIDHQCVAQEFDQVASTISDLVAVES